MKQKQNEEKKINRSKDKVVVYSFQGGKRARYKTNVDLSQQTWSYSARISTS